MAVKYGDFAGVPASLYDDMYADLYTNPYGDVKCAEDVYAVSERLKREYRELFSVDRLPDKAEYNVSYEYRDEPRGFYRQSRLKIRLFGKLYMMCYLLTPTAPAENPAGVVALCGHGYGARQIIGQAKNGGKRLIPFLDVYQKNFALELVKRGNTVIVPELIGFGEAREKRDINKPFYASSCASLSTKLLPFGFTVAGIRIYEARRCLDILVNECGINEGRLGCMGISGGGLVSLYTAVTDERVSRCVVSGYVNTFKDSILSRWHCPDNFFPNVLAIGEIYDAACTLAPNKLLCEFGENDKIFPVSGSRTAAEHISRIYELCGVPESFTADFFTGKHQISGKYSFDFFN